MTLQPFDILVLGIVGFTLIRGWLKGMAWQIASLAAITVSYFVAIQFRGPVAEQISVAPPWNTFAAMLLLYLGTSLVIWLMFRRVRQSIEKMKMRDFDRQMGALFGLAKGLALSGVVTLFAVSLSGQPMRQSILESKSGHAIAQMMVRADQIMPREMRQVLAPHLERLDQGLEQAGYPSNETRAGGGQPGYDPAIPGGAKRRSFPRENSSLHCWRFAGFRG